MQRAQTPSGTHGETKILSAHSAGGKQSNVAKIRSEGLNATPKANSSTPEQGFHTPVANVIHAVSLLGHIQDPAVQQSVQILQHVCVQLNEKDKMTSLSRSQGQGATSQTPRGRPRRREGTSQNDAVAQAPPNITRWPQ